MKNDLIQLFSDYPQYAFLLSLGVSIIVAILGVIPSFFITGANMLFFGFWRGLLLSFLGEAVGAVIAFILYRKGFKKASSKALERHPRAQKLISVEGREAFTLILSLRLLPFVPSGLVTFAAAVGRVGLPLFFAASSLGKLPALLIEAYSVYQVTQFGWQGKLILGLCGAYLIWLVLSRKK